MKLFSRRQEPRRPRIVRSYEDESEEIEAEQLQSEPDELSVFDEEKYNQVISELREQIQQAQGHVASLPEGPYTPDQATTIRQETMMIKVCSYFVYSLEVAMELHKEVDEVKERMATLEAENEAFRAEFPPFQEEETKLA